MKIEGSIGDVEGDWLKWGDTRWNCRVGSWGVQAERRWCAQERRRSSEGVRAEGLERRQHWS